MNQRQWVFCVASFIALILATVLWQDNVGVFTICFVAIGMFVQWLLRDRKKPNQDTP
jgi:hypothetical protein